MSSQPSISKWDQRYRDAVAPGEPAAVLSQHLHLLPAQGDAVDLACGLGANALLLARQGLNAAGWDLSAVALEKLSEYAAQQQRPVNTLLRDIETNPPAPESADVIVVSDFLFRPICPAIAAALRPGGLLFYSTWCAEKRTSSGPSSPAFLLQPNELLHLFPGLQIRFYREDAHAGNLELGDRNRAHLIAQRPA